jgi:hypothetical protein
LRQLSGETFQELLAQFVIEGGMTPERGLLRRARLSDPIFGDFHFRSSKQACFGGDERSKHAENRPQPALVSDERDTMEMTPMSESEGGVVPQGLEIEAREVVAKGVKHVDAAVSHQGLDFGDKDVPVILMGYLAGCFNAYRILRQSFDNPQHGFAPSDPSFVLPIRRQPGCGRHCRGRPQGPVAAPERLSSKNAPQIRAIRDVIPIFAFNRRAEKSLPAASVLAPFCAKA